MVRVWSTRLEWKLLTSPWGSRLGVSRRPPAAHGAAQEYTNLPAAQVVRLPAGTSFDIGASLGVPAMTAHRALTVSEHGPRRLHPGALDGKVVLVAGGAEAVGHAVIQLARWVGATAITTISGPAKGALETAAGAHHVINFGDEDVASASRRSLLGGPAANYRILGDRAWPELAAVSIHVLAFQGSFQVRICRWRFSRSPATLLILLPMA
jgi:NADPH:quinone reductase-like Zn-dependent oxidoreductase